MSDHIILFFVSLLANFLSALAGGGAGLLQLPALIFLGLPFATAMATHKIATVTLGMGASIKHLRAGTLDLKFAGFILLAGLPGVIIGAFGAVHLPEILAKTSLGLLTISLGIYSWSKKDLGQLSAPTNRHHAGLIKGALVIFVIGILNGALASGTGLFVTLWLIRWFGLDYKQAVAYTMILVGLFWNGSGALAVNLLNPAQWSWLPALIAGSIIGGYAGTHIAIIKGNGFIKKMFEILTLACGLWLLWNAWQPHFIYS
jgi:uncharacterized protein